MKSLVGVSLVAALLIVSSSGRVVQTQKDNTRTWALLIAGSNTYSNYRHQADICHAYHLLLNNGFDEEYIIVMMYDDIAHNPENPTPGVIINKPNGTDVYRGVSIDYSGDDVTPENFLAVLTGRSEKLNIKGVSTRRVIKSNSNDYVFVNFADHGGEGILGFPNDLLYASDLQKSLQYMTKNRLYKQMALYIEACNAGSMFDGLLAENTNIIAVTASASDESSYACYYDRQRKTYLGDCFSVNWMADSETEMMTGETIDHQFQTVRRATTDSHVQLYGDLDVGDLSVSIFQGWLWALGGKTLHQTRKIITHSEDAVSSREVPVEILKRQYQAAEDPESRLQANQKLEHTMTLRRHLDDTFTDIISKVANGNDAGMTSLLDSNHKYSPSIISCYEPLVKHFSSKCFDLAKNTYGLTKLKAFVNLCSVSPSSFEAAIEAMNTVCGQRTLLSGIH